MTLLRPASTSTGPSRAGWPSRRSRLALAGVAWLALGLALPARGQDDALPEPEITPLAASPLPQPTGTPFPPPGALNKPIGQILFAEPGTLVVVDGVKLQAVDLREAYAQRDYEPAWGGGAWRPRIERLLAALDDSASHGLDPRDYHVERIRARLDGAQAGDAEARTALDLLASDASIRLVRHVSDGRTPPPIGDKEASFPREAIDPARVVSEVSTSDDPARKLAELSPNSPEYDHLRAALARYRQAAQAGGWPKIPEGPAVRPGTADPVIPAVRQRLAATGELAVATDLSSREYDAALADAVKSFQGNQGLTADGTLNKATRGALSVDVQRRIDQILVNLERLRWMGPSRGERHILVNVPTFRLAVVERGETVLEMPVVVGKPKLRTPSFSSAVDQVVFNPSWNVPKSIATKEILPKAAGDADYLARQGYKVRRTTVRTAADPDDPEAATTRSVVVGLSQPPGPKNPLGRVKFLMPNGFGVYLHDSPSRSYFSMPTRTYSHGCVRLGKALALADELMSDREGWSEARRKRILSGWTTQYFPLEPPIPVHLVYQTAWADPGGAVSFRSDPYGRDAALLQELPRTPPSSLQARADLPGSPQPRSAAPR